MQQISPTRVVLDFVVLVVCAIPLLIFQQWVQPYNRGFYCDDESIRYPYRENTISSLLLVILGCSIPVTIIFFFEVLRVAVWETKRNCSGSYQPIAYRFMKFTVHRLIVRLYIFIGYFALALCFNQVLTDIAKYSIGRLRPHFIDVCRPKGIWDVPCPTSQTEIYIDVYECTGTGEYRLQDAHLSFYSGHSSLSFCAALYTVLYLQARVYQPLHSRILLPAIQFALIAMATFCAYSRVSDFKHHWSDVLFGAVMGSLVAAFVGLFVAELFNRREPPCGNEGLATETPGGLVTKEEENGVSNNPPIRSDHPPQLVDERVYHQEMAPVQRHDTADKDNGRF